jgi:hypothetical protein
MRFVFPVIDTSVQKTFLKCNPVKCLAANLTAGVQIVVGAGIFIFSKMLKTSRLFFYPVDIWRSLWV